MGNSIYSTVLLSELKKAVFLQESICGQMGRVLLTPVGVSKLKIMKAWQQLKEAEQLRGTSEVIISLSGT